MKVIRQRHFEILLEMKENYYLKHVNRIVILISKQLFSKCCICDSFYRNKYHVVQITSGTDCCTSETQTTNLCDIADFLFII